VKSNTETGMRVLAVMFMVATIIMLLLTVQAFSGQQRVAVTTVLIAVSWAIFPAIFGYLVLKGAKALEYLADIRDRVK
jgi:ascorbate-specific PTS system EIIC-type component UlaA